MSDEFDRDLLRSLKGLLDRTALLQPAIGALTPLGERVQQHLGRDVTALPVVQEHVLPFRLVDADLALAVLGDGGELLGVRGPNREHEDLATLLANDWARTAVGAVDYTLAPSGPDARRRIVAFGLRLFRFEDAPVAVLQRAANPRFGRESAVLEVLAPDTEGGERLLAAVRRLMHERSVLRGQVLTFSGRGEFGESGASVFVPRTPVPPEDVVLPDGLLDEIRGHVLDIARLRDVLLASGRHLKRGVLLYGPPGTGKTLTVRHLVGEAADMTVVLLTGPAIGMIGQATDLARGLQPAMVVLEDIDLVAMERGRSGPQPLLFAVLDALDGLDGDADVTFLMTTNRVEVLERALAQRPGRVDLAVEVPRPDADARRRLFALYARGVGLGAAAVDAAAERADGVTASFAKELMRRVVLRAAQAGRPVTDADLDEALTAMLDAGAVLTRSLLGMGDASDASDGDDPAPSTSAASGWTGLSPLSGHRYRPRE